MLDAEDYKEPSCALCGGKEFYAPDPKAPKGTVPVNRVIGKLEKFLEEDDMESAVQLLEYWKAEAGALNDLRGELSICNELLGAYRKTGKKEKGLGVINRTLYLLGATGLEGTYSEGTILVNVATTYKSFGMAEKGIPYFIKAEKDYAERLTENAPELGALYNNYALALADLKRFKDAEDLYFKAVSVMEKVKNGKPDLAITYVNLAHLYELTGNKKGITDCLWNAVGLLNDEDVDKNGYYAYVLKKCYPSYEHFGYSKIAEEMKMESDKFYAGVTYRRKLL